MAGPERGLDELEDGLLKHITLKWSKSIQTNETYGFLKAFRDILNSIYPRKLSPVGGGIWTSVPYDRFVNYSISIKKYCTLHDSDSDSHLV